VRCRVSHAAHAAGSVRNSMPEFDLMSEKERRSISRDPETHTRGCQPQKTKTEGAFRLMIRFLLLLLLPRCCSRFRPRSKRVITPAIALWDTRDDTAGHWPVCAPTRTHVQTAAHAFRVPAATCASALPVTWTRRTTAADSPAATRSRAETVREEEKRRSRKLLRQTSSALSRRPALLSLSKFPLSLTHIHSHGLSLTLSMKYLMANGK
jgi:hypothetical protein